MIGLLLGLLGAGAMLGGAAMGNSFRPPAPTRSNPNQVSFGSGSSGSGSSYGYYSYTPPSHSSSWNSSGENEEQVFRFDKETGRLEVF